MTVTIPRDNSLHLPAGSIVIGRGAASLHRQTYANPRGYARHQRGRGQARRSGRTAAVYLPCGGTGGKTIRNHLASGHVPNVLRTGADSSTGYSRDTATSTIASTGKTLAKIELFGGALKARAVTVHARAARDDSGAVHRSNALGRRAHGQRQVPGGQRTREHEAGHARVGHAVDPSRDHDAHRREVRGLDLVLAVTKNGLKRGTNSSSAPPTPRRRHTEAVGARDRPRIERAAPLPRTADAAP